MSLLPIQSPAGDNEGWIDPSLVVHVAPGSGQRCIQWRDKGQIRTSCRRYGYPDDLFMKALGLYEPY